MNVLNTSLLSATTLKHFTDTPDNFQEMTMYRSNSTDNITEEFETGKNLSVSTFLAIKFDLL